jgi:hypothetical protein
MRRTLALLFALGSSAAYANSSVVVMTDTDDAAAVQVALAGRGIDVQVVTAPEGVLRIDRAAAALRAAVDHHAAAAVWIDAVPGNTMACVVSADGDMFREAPLPLVEGSPRMFAAIAVSLLDEVFTPSVAVPVVPVVPIIPIGPIGAAAARAPVASLLRRDEEREHEEREHAEREHETNEHDERERVTASAPALANSRAPRFMLDIGGFAASRGINFVQALDVQFPPPRVAYPAQGMSGVVVNLAAYPWPEAGARDVSGLGFSLRIARSIGTTFAALDQSSSESYTYEHTEVEGAVHYRHEMGPYAIDSELDAGKITDTIKDLPQDIIIPDTAYSYVGAGAHAYARTGGATIGGGARYLDIHSAGDITSDAWFGAARVYGYGFDASVIVALPRSLYLKGTVNWTREHFEFGFGSPGALSLPTEVFSADDTNIMGAASLGIAL